MELKSPTVGSAAKPEPFAGGDAFPFVGALIGRGDRRGHNFFSTLERALPITNKT